MNLQNHWVLNKSTPWIWIKIRGNLFILFLHFITSCMRPIISPTDTIKILISAALAECFPLQTITFDIESFIYLDPKEWTPISFLKPLHSQKMYSGHDLSVLTGSHNPNHMFFILRQIYASSLDYILLHRHRHMFTICISLSLHSIPGNNYNRIEHPLRKNWTVGDWGIEKGRTSDRMDTDDRWDLKGSLDVKMNAVCHCS